MNSTAAVHASSTSSPAGSRRKVTAIGLVAILITGGCCYRLYGHGLSLTPNFSFLHGFWGVAAGVAGIFVFLAAPRAMRGMLLSCWICIWLTAGYAELRESAITDGIVLGGIIPYSDANNFIREASRLIEGHNLTDWGSRRPLADSYLAGQLYLSGDHLSVALLFIGIFNAVAIGLTAAEVRRTMGFLAAATWAWLMLVYVRRYIGDTVSEQAGIAFGVMGTALLLRAFQSGLLWSLSIGLFILGLALNARAGAFVVLPALVVAAILRWRKPRRIRVTLLAVASVCAPFLLSFVFLKLVGAQQGRLMSNYHDHLYGIIFGGNWQTAAADIPNFDKMSESARTKEIDRRIFAAVKAKPSLLWRGALRNWSDFFTHTKEALGPYSFFRDPDTEYALLAFSAAGLLLALTMWNRLSLLILATGIGVVLSVPFIPAADADLMRAYAATMPVMFLVPSFALSGWRDWVRRVAPKVCDPSLGENAAENEIPIHQDWLNKTAFLYLAIMFLVPLAARFVFPVSPPIAMKEHGQLVEATLDLRRADWIEFVPSSKSRPANMRFVPAELFINNIFGVFRWFNPKQGEFLDQISHPKVALVCPGSADAAFLVIDAEHLEGPQTLIVVRGRWHQAESSYSASFLEDSVELRGPSN